MSRVGILVCASLLAACAEEPRATADFVFTNARVYTAVESQPWAEAVAIKGNEIDYVGDKACGEDFGELRRANAHQWRQVFEEDRGVVEGMQLGRVSQGFTGGVFSPVMDGPTHCFHKWLAACLLDTLEAPSATSRHMVRVV